MSNSAIYELEDSITEQVTDLADKAVAAQKLSDKSRAETVLYEGIIGLFTLYINENNLIQDFEDWAGTVAQRIRERNPEANGNVQVPQETFVEEGPAPAMDEPAICDCYLCNLRDAEQTESSR